MTSLPARAGSDVRFGPAWVRATLALALLYFPVCGLAGLPFGNGGRYASVLAGPLALLYLLAGFHGRWRELAVEARDLLVPFVPLLAACLLVLLVHDHAEVGEPFSRVLWAVPIALAARRIGITRAAVFSAAAIGALFYFGAALVDIYLNGAPRAGMRVNNVIFAETASLCAGLAFVASVYQRDAPLWLRAAWLTAGVAGLTAVAMSGSRGPLLATLWLVLVLGATAWRRRHGNAVPIALLAVAAVVTLAWALTPLGARVLLAVNEIEGYQAAAQPTLTSVGIRLQLWRIALTSLGDQWLLGLGYSTLEQLAPQLPALQFLPRELLETLHHFHADWAHALMAGGLVLLAGLGASMGLLLYQSRYDAGRLWLVGAMLVFGLTDLAFFRKPTLTLFVASWGLLLAARQAAPHAHPQRPLPR